MAAAGIIALPTGQRPQLVWRGPDPATLTDDQRAQVAQAVDRIGSDAAGEAEVLVAGPPVDGALGLLVGAVVRSTLAGASAFVVTDVVTAVSARRTLETLSHIDQARTRP